MRPEVAAKDHICDHTRASQSPARATPRCRARRVAHALEIRSRGPDEAARYRKRRRNSLTTKGAARGAKGWSNSTRNARLEPRDFKRAGIAPAMDWPRPSSSRLHRPEITATKKQEGIPISKTRPIKGNRVIQEERWCAVLAAG